MDVAPFKQAAVVDCRDVCSADQSVLEAQAAAGQVAAQQHIVDFRFVRQVRVVGCSATATATAASSVNVPVSHDWFMIDSLNINAAPQ